METKLPDPSSKSDDSPVSTSQQQDTVVDDLMILVPTEVVIPPAAPCLPVQEPGGVTSAAVQPPGSTGEPITRVPTNESSEYPDSITDEEVAMLDEQEEEERLIRNGGNGIPFGPVSFPPPCLRLRLSKPTTGWSPKTTLTSGCSPTRR